MSAKIEAMPIRIELAGDNSLNLTVDSGSVGRLKRNIGSEKSVATAEAGRSRLSKAYFLGEGHGTRALLSLPYGDALLGRVGEEDALLGARSNQLRGVVRGPPQEKG